MVLAVLWAVPAVAAPLDLRPVESAPRRELVLPPLRCGACVATLVTGAATYAVAWLGSTLLMGAAMSQISEQPTDDGMFGFIDTLIIRPIELGSTLGIAMPVIGPMVGTLYFRDNPTLQTLAWVDAGVQVVGLTAMVVSVVMQRAYEQSAHDEATKPAVKLAVVPLVRPGASGMALGGTF
jgi:hypothetical protein